VTTDEDTFTLFLSADTGTMWGAPVPGTDAALVVACTRVANPLPDPSPLAGDWCFEQLRTPTRLLRRQVNNFADFYFDVLGETSRGDVTISASGAITGDATGTLKPLPYELVSLILDGHFEEVALFPSADGSVLWGLRDPGPNENALIALTRVPLSPFEVVLDVEDQIPQLLWLGDNSLKLQKLDHNFNWIDVPGSTGQSAFQGDPAPMGIFRLTEVP